MPLIDLTTRRKQMLRLSFLPTPGDVLRAKQVQQQEREAVTQETGIRFDGDRPIPPPYRIHCRQPGCVFVGSATTEGQAINALCAHIVLAHKPEGTAA